MDDRRKHTMRARSEKNSIACFSPKRGAISAIPVGVVLRC